MRILLVEDDPLQLKAMKRMLSAANHEVVTLQRNPWLEELEDIDVVVTDWQPYGMDTVCACNEAIVPVVIVTGGNAPNVRVQTGLSVPVLQKPVQKADLLTELAEVVA